MDQVVEREWHVACRSEKVSRENILTIKILGEEVILWRSGERALAWENLCIHRGARLSLGKIRNGLLQCAYHGWIYNDEGRCVEIPAQPGVEIPKRACVRAFQVVEKLGLIWINLSDADTRPVNLPEFDDESFFHVICGPYSLKASAPRIIENFLDIAHFPFVHEGFLGVADKALIENYEVRTENGGICADGIRIHQPDPDGTGVGKVISYDYHVHRPFVASLGKDSGDGTRFSLIFFVTPVSETESKIFAVESMNYAHDLDRRELEKFQDLITSQDVPVVESQRPERLPLDLQAELHLRADKLSIAYRRYLNELGLSFGTS